MRIIYLRKLLDFSRKHGDAVKSLSVWKNIVDKAEWKSPTDIRESFPTVKIINGLRSRFKIVGNKYRIIIEVDFEDELVEIRFIGTHAEYDTINALII